MDYLYFPKFLFFLFFFFFVRLLSPSALIMNYFISSNLLKLMYIFCNFFLYLYYSGLDDVTFRSPRNRSVFERETTKPFIRMKRFLLCETLSMIMIVGDLVPLIPTIPKKKLVMELMAGDLTIPIQRRKSLKERKKYCFGHFRLIITNSLVIRMHYPSINNMFGRSTESWHLLSSYK